MSVKKKTSVRRPAPTKIDVKVKAKSEAPSGAQPAAERKLGEAELRTLIDRFAPAHRRLVTAVRRSLRKRLPTAYEVIYEYREWFVISFSPNEHGYSGIFAIHGSAEGVKLYFNRGKELPDPEKLLQGKGGQARSIDIEAASTLTRPEVVRLIDEAIARTPAPFPPAGSGPVILLSASTKKRQRG